MNKLIVTTFTADELQSIIVDAVKMANLEIDNHLGAFEINDDYMSQREVAKFLRITLPTLIRWKRLKKIPYYQEGRKVLFKKSELLSVMQKNKSLLR